MTSPVFAPWRTLPQNGTHAAFGGFAHLPNGLYFAVWRDAASHLGGTAGVIAGAYSSDLGKTWSPPIAIVEGALDLRDPSLTVSRDGKTVWLTYFDYTIEGGLACRVWIRTSTDGGSTFGPPRLVAEAADGFVASCSPVVELANGELVVPCYAKLAAAAPYDSAYLYRSRDRGETWNPTPSIIATGGRHYQEPCVIALRNGALLAAFRYGTEDRIAVNASLDGGYTWGAPVPKFTGSGKPMILELATGPLICLYRALPSRDLAMRISNDRGGTWGAEQIVVNPVGQMSYAAAVEVEPGVATGIVGCEDSGSTSRNIGFTVRH